MVCVSVLQSNQYDDVCVCSRRLCVNMIYLFGVVSGYNECVWKVCLM